MAHFVAGSEDDRRRARTLVIAVDLGFSENDASCGIAWRADGHEEVEAQAFGRCVERVAELVRGHNANHDTALIVEAPLSSCFNARGNPMARDYGATRENGNSLESGRGWYYGAGAAVALAALFFVRRLRDSLRETDATVVVFEGFVSFKRTKSEHIVDARKLLDHFFGDVVGHVVRAPPSGEMVTALRLVGEDAERAPLVLIPPPPPARRRPSRRRASRK
jgi:hypothetical protein